MDINCNYCNNYCFNSYMPNYNACDNYCSNLCAPSVVYEIAVINEGQYNARFSVTYFYSGSHNTITSPPISPSHNKSVSVPKGATSVQINVTNLSSKPYKVFCQKFLSYATTKQIIVYGTKFNPYCD